MRTSLLRTVGTSTATTGVTFTSTPTTVDLELDDYGPGVGRGPIAHASRDDDSGEITVRVFTDSPLPLGLVEQFLAEVARTLPPDSKAAGTTRGSG